MPGLGDILSAAVTGRNQQDVTDAYALKNAQVQDTLAQVPLRGAQTQAALAEAAKNRLAAMAAQRAQDAQDRHEEALALAGVPADQAHLIANSEASGYGNFEQAAGGIGKLQQNKFYQTLGDAAAPPEERLAAQAGIKGEVPNPFVALPPASIDLRALGPAGAPPKQIISKVGDATIDAKNATTAATEAKTKLAASGQFSESRAQLIAAGKMPGPTQYEFTRNPTEANNLMDRVTELNPNFSSTDLPLSQQTTAEFNKGKSGQAVQSVNAASQHLLTMRDLIKALDNKDTQAFNSVANFFAAQTGDPAPTNVDEVGQFVGTELMKTVAGANAGSQDERKHLADMFAIARSTKQLTEAAEYAEHLLNGQALALERRFQSGRGIGDFRSRFLPETRQMLGLTDATPALDATVTPGAHVATPAKAAATPPPAAATAGMKEGDQRTFGNGQTWKIQGGKPVQVR